MLTIEGQPRASLQYCLIPLRYYVKLKNFTCGRSWPLYIVLADALLFRQERP